MANEPKRPSMSDRQYSGEIRKMNAIDRAVNSILQSIDPTYADRKLMSKQDAEFQKIIDRQLDIAKGVAGNQIVDFIATIKAQQMNGNGRPRGRSSPNGVDTADLFTQNIGDIFEYFQDVNKNRFMEVSDLKFISKFIPSMGEAVRIYLDAIVSSDDVSDSITRKLGLDSITSDDERKTATAAIEEIEDEMELHKKLKVAWRKTLVTGSFYCYHISYRDLFGMYSKGIADGTITRDGDASMGNPRMSPSEDTNPGRLENHTGRKFPKKMNVLGIAQESFTVEQQAKDINNPKIPRLVTDVEPVFESYGDTLRDVMMDGLLFKANIPIDAAMEGVLPLISEDTMPTVGGKKVDVKDFTKQMTEAIEADLPNVYFINSPIPYAAMEEADAMESFREFFNERKDLQEQKRDVEEIPDGTYDMPGHSHKRGQKFDGISGTYLKWIDFKNALPIDIFGQRVGYYHIITTPKNRKKRKSGTSANGNSGILSTGSMSLFDAMDVTEKRKEAAIQNIVDTISTCILDQFSLKFVRKNAAFKKMIADCIIANGLVDNDYMIQFIPVDNMIEFKVNEDEDGNGESILSESVFPAHLLLSIVVCKMLNYINKGGDKTIAHISSGKVTKSLSNQVNRVIRDLQASNVTFTDLLSSSMVFSKVTRDSNLAMPKDLAGNRLVEFETQDGQDIDLNTNYEEMLERWCMIGTGLPPTVMDYLSNVEIAKKVVSDNIRVAGRVASMQTDLEKPTTELYRVLIEDSDMSEEIKKNLVGNFTFHLPRPRILANQNNSETLSSAYQNGQLMANILKGEDDQEPEMMRKRAIITRLYVEKEVGFIDWTEMKDLEKEADKLYQMEIVEKQARPVINKGTGSGTDASIPFEPSAGGTAPEEEEGAGEDLGLDEDIEESET